jgi:hypothetical protein
VIVKNEMKMKTTNYIAMKKLTNVSPFLLLLVPVFIMMLLTFASGALRSQSEDVALKATPEKNTLTKVSDPLVK